MTEDRKAAVELKPCPFCRTTELLGVEAVPYPVGHGFLYVVCRKCGCIGGGRGADTEAMAREVWNTALAALPQPAEAGWRPKETHILDEEGGPLVGILLDLPNSEQVWTGEVANATFAKDEDAAAEFEVNAGRFLIHAARGAIRILARVASVDAGVELARAYAASLRPTPPAAEGEVAG